MIETAALLIIVLVSIVAVRAGAVALTMTGISMDMATFQSLSAFTGTGFTTSEAESIVTHPARRRIIQFQMLLGNAGLFSALAALIISFSQTQGESLFTRFLVTISGLLVLLLLSKSRYLNQKLNAVLQVLFARFPILNLRDYESLLRMDKGYAISHMHVEDGSWLCKRTLRDLDLISEGLLVLNLEREDGYLVGTPGPNTLLRAGDQLLIYGQEADVAHLNRRESGAAGETAHQEAVERQRLRRAHESADDIL
jgi:hypothetical protein